MTSKITKMRFVVFLKTSIEHRFSETFKEFYGEEYIDKKKVNNSETYKKAINGSLITLEVLNNNKLDFIIEASPKPPFNSVPVFDESKEELESHFKSFCNILTGDVFFGSQVRVGVAVNHVLPCKDKEAVYAAINSKYDCINLRHPDNSDFYLKFNTLSSFDVKTQDKPINIKVNSLTSLSEINGKIRFGKMDTVPSTNVFYAASEDIDANSSASVDLSCLDKKGLLTLLNELKCKAIVATI